MSAIINGDSPSVTFSDGTTQSTAFTTGAVNQAKMGTNVAGTGPAFSAYLSSTQSVSSNVLTKVTFQTEEFDTNSNYDTTTYRFTPTVAGYYQVNSNIQAAVTPTSLLTAVYKNGSIFKVGTNPSGATFYGASVSALVYLNGSTDYIEIYTRFSVGQAISVSATDSYFQASMVRAA